MKLTQKIRYAKPVAFFLLKRQLEGLGFNHQTYKGRQIEEKYRAHDKALDRRIIDGEFAKMHVFTLPVAEAFRKQFPTRPASGFKDSETEAFYRQVMVNAAHAFRNVQKDARNKMGKLIFSWGQPHEFMNYSSQEGMPLPHVVGELQHLPEFYHIVVLESKSAKTLEKERRQREQARASGRVLRLRR